jgi:hypothetical protein
MNVPAIVQFTARNGPIYIDATWFHAVMKSGPGSAIHLGGFPSKYFAVDEQPEEVVAAVERAQREATDATIRLCLARIKEACEQEREKKV